MSKIEDCGPAFPVPGLSNLPNGNYIHPEFGMSLRQYAAIRLRVPNSGTPWLDEMIITRLRDDLAAKAMLEKGFERAYVMADAMLAARGEEK